jgi:alpha-2-macroglobulin
VREGDRFSAGVVVNQRAGGTRSVEVEATARGITLSGDRKKSATLTGAAGQEVRFDFTGQAGDSAALQFAVRGGDDADAVAVNVPVRPGYYPLAQTIAGSVRDTATALLTLEQDVDPARSRLEISFGSSTLAIVRGARSRLRVYPYYCTEQVSSAALPLIALYRAHQQNPAVHAPATAQNDIQSAVRTIVRRQRPDGGIGYWTMHDWSTPWLTAYAARVLLEARAAGFAVDSTVLTRAGEYLTRTLHQPERPRFAIARWYENRAMTLSDRIAAVDVLSRMGMPDVAVENTLLAQASSLFWEDRVLLAEIFARRGAIAPARNLLTAAWQRVTPSGRKLTLPDSGAAHYFESSARPAARLLTATLAVDPNHPQLGALVETVIDHGRAGARDIWNTQDYGSTVLALMAFEQTRHQTGQATIRINGPGGPILTRTAGAEARDTTIALTGLVQGNVVRLNIVAQNANTPVYYFMTMREVPKTRPVTPISRGIQVERWYERVDTKVPVTRVNAGDLVRVRLRVTVPDDRQFLILDDPLPAGLEAVDLSLRTVRPPGMDLPEDIGQQRDDGFEGWYYGTWDSGVWSAFDYKELRDDRVIYFATYLWKGTHTATYLARATTPGTFVLPPAHAEEMYNPGVNGRTAGGEFVVNAPVR